MTNSYPFSIDHRQNPVNPDGTDAWRITPETPEKAMARDSRYYLDQLQDLPANVKMFHPFFNNWSPDEAVERAYEYFQGQLVHVHEGEIDILDNGESYEVTFPGERTTIVHTFEGLIGALTYGLTKAWTDYADRLAREEAQKSRKNGRKILSNDISEIGLLRLQGLI